MALTRDDALADLEGARGYFQRHINGMGEAHWDTKLVPHINSVRQILVHMLATDRAVLAMLQGEPFEIQRHMTRHKEAAQEIAAQSPAAVLALYDAGGEAIAEYIRATFTDADDPVTLWGSPGTLGGQLGSLSQEIAYHTGQVSLLRQALEPDWNYFKDVFGMEGF